MDANLLGVTSNPKHMEARPALGDVRMIVLDPIALVVKRDSHKNVETRHDLQPFADLCASRGACGHRSRSRRRRRFRRAF